MYLSVIQAKQGPEMPSTSIVRIGHLKTVSEFQEHVANLGIDLPCDTEILVGSESPLSQPAQLGTQAIGNRFAIHPMEGWDAETDGNPSDHTIRRWQNFGLSGAKLIWGGEAVAVRPSGRANPNQLYAADHTQEGLGKLLEALLQAHRQEVGDTDDLLVGLQLTHSGRFCRPNDKSRMEPQILYNHPILDVKFHVDPDLQPISDGQIQGIIQDYIKAAVMASELGYGFVDIKHCHGYLGHEFLSAFSRPGPYGGTFENRTRFLREIVEGIRAVVPELMMGVRLSGFDFVPYKPDPSQSDGRKLGPGIPENFSDCLPYDFGFGVDRDNPIRPDLDETCKFLDLLGDLDIPLVNLTAGSPYYNPHIQRPAYYPPSDGYKPPEDPLVGVARQIDVVSRIKANYPELLIVGTAYSYLQEYLPHVCQGLVRDGKVDFIGLGRMALSYPDLPRDVLAGGELTTRKICRTFSDCTTAPRNGLVSGCFPLDSYYKKSPEAKRLREIKKAAE
jgi:NADPH2 dehydrogenase